MFQTSCSGIYLPFRPFGLYVFLTAWRAAVSKFQQYVNSRTRLGWGFDLLNANVPDVYMLEIGSPYQ